MRAVCKRHQLEAKRHHSTPSYIPKWKNPNSKPSPMYTCSYPKCTVSEKLIEPKFESTDSLGAALGIKPSPGHPLLLCREHYNDAYKHFHPQTTCASCGALAKRGNSFSHHSPEAYAVSVHLKETTGNDICIQPQELVCLTCYKLHLSIVEALKAEQCTSDNALRKSMSIWDVKLNDPTTDALTKATLRAVLYLSEQFLQQKAVLLPQVCLDAYGVSHSGSIVSVELNPEVGDSLVKFSSRWLLHQLIIYLHPYMEYKCVHKKYGTMLVASTSFPIQCSTSLPIGTSTSLPNECSTSLLAQSNTSLPTESSTSLPTESSTTFPNESSTSFPNESSTSFPNESSTSFPNESSTSLPNESSTSLDTYVSMD